MPLAGLVYLYVQFRWTILQNHVDCNLHGCVVWMWYQRDSGHFVYLLEHKIETLVITLQAKALVDHTGIRSPLGCLPPAWREGKPCAVEHSSLSLSAVFYLQEVSSKGILETFVYREYILWDIKYSCHEMASIAGCRVKFHFYSFLLVVVKWENI